MKYVGTYISAEIYLTYHYIFVLYSLGKSY